MKQLLVRQVPDHLVAELKRRAGANGRSAEAEHREILEQALRPKRDFTEFLLSLPTLADDDVDQLFTRDKDTGRDLDDLF